MPANDGGITEGDKRAIWDRRESAFLREYSELCNRHGLRLASQGVPHLSETDLTVCNAVPGDALVSNDGGVWWEPKGEILDGPKASESPCEAAQWHGRTWHYGLASDLADECKDFDSYDDGPWHFYDGSRIVIVDSVCHAVDPEGRVLS